MKITLCGKEIDCGVFTVAKMNELNNFLLKTKDKDFFTNPYSTKDYEEMAKVLSKVCEGQIDEKKIIAEAEVVEILVAINTLQMVVNDSFNKAIAGMVEDSSFFTGLKAAEALQDTP